MMSVLNKQSYSSSSQIVQVSTNSDWLKSLGHWDYFMTIRNGPVSTVHGLRTRIQRLWRDNKMDKLFFVVEKDKMLNNYHSHILYSGPNWKRLDRSSLQGLNVHFEPVRDQIGSTVYVSKYLGSPLCPDYDVMINGV